MAGAASARSGNGSKIRLGIFLIGGGPPTPLGLMCFQELTRGSSPAIPMILFGLGAVFYFQYFSGGSVFGGARRVSGSLKIVSF